MSDMCDYPMCTAPIINGVPLCHHSQTTDASACEFPVAPCRRCGGRSYHAIWCSDVHWDACGPGGAAMPIPCRPIEYPHRPAAEVARRQKEKNTGRPHEVYLCPEMHLHVQEVG